MLVWILIGVIVLLSLVLLWLFLTRAKLPPSASTLGSWQSDLRQIHEHLRSLLGQQGESKSSQERLEADLEKTLSHLNRLQTQLEERRGREEERAREQSDSLQRITSTLLGSKSSGALGENILSDRLKELPAEWLINNWKLGSLVVEFGFRLFDGRVIPIDSKVVGGEKLRALSTAETEEKKKLLWKEINKEAVKKIKEVSRYLNPPRTYHKAIMTVPDALIASLEPETRKTALQHSIYLLSYSALLPVLLAIVEIERQHQDQPGSREIQAFLTYLRQDLSELQRTLDESIAKGGKMISNAYDHSTLLVHRILSRLEALEKEEAKTEELEKVL